MKDKFVGISRVGEKGQIVIPKEARTLFNIKQGDTLLILGDDENGIFTSFQSLILSKSEIIFISLS